MGIFYDRSEKSENGRTYLVLKSKPLTDTIIICFSLVFVFFYAIFIKTGMIKFLSLISAVCLGAIIIILVLFIKAKDEGNVKNYTNRRLIIKNSRYYMNRDLTDYENVFVRPFELWIEKPPIEKELNQKNYLVKTYNNRAETMISLDNKVFILKEIGSRKFFKRYEIWLEK